MAKTNDPALYESGFERFDKDRYWTQPWITQALLDTVSVPNMIWEPAAGRGDIVTKLIDNGRDVVASDVDLSEFDYFLCPTIQHNFIMAVPPLYEGHPDIKGIITNPPYNQPRGIADDFVRHGLFLMENFGIEFMAMLLRSEFCRGKRRRDMFGDNPMYAGEIVLTSRPRWDWWFRDEPEASPRHNFSWFIWRNDPEFLTNRMPQQWFHYGRGEKV